MRLIYLHGFRSSSRSFKARLLQARFAAAGMTERFLAPDLPVEPDAAIALVQREIRPLDSDTLVGSSLGGCYATWLAEQVGCKAVLLNPAVRPARDLATQVGPQTGYHDGHPFEFRQAYVEQLRRYEIGDISRPERYFLIAAQGDEVLDWREMVAHYPGARQRIIPGSDHGLSDFEDWIDEVFAFAGFAPEGMST
jgi:uncharacterized protein